MRVAIFCRVSTRDKGQDTENQLRQLEAFAAKQGWTVVKVYLEHASGRKGEREREVLGQVFADAGRRKWDCLLFWSLDRLTRRGAYVTMQYLSRLSEMGVAYRSFSEEYISSMGVFGDVVVSLLATLARQEALRISERTIAGLEKARAQGRVGGRPRAKVTAEQVLRLHKAGKSLNYIAGELHVGKSTVHRLLNGASGEHAKKG